MSILAITSMYANPLHPGHIECLELSKSETGAEELWVIINSDRQAELKRGTKSFQDEQFRMKIVESLKPVDRVFLSIDQDSSVCMSLKYLIDEAKASGKYEKIIFTKGGDRFATEIPEAILLRSEGVEIVDGLGAKSHSSSDFVTKVKDRTDEKNLESKLAKLPELLTTGGYLEIGNRPWGVYYVMEDNLLYKVKKIIVEPGCRLSLQSHEKRSEHWTVVSGIATVDIRGPEFKTIEQLRILKENEGCHIPVGYLHRLANSGTEPLVIVEVQCGEYTGEDDIVRFDDEYGRVK
ncbi:MAG: adenylyltransferase/cytidyltransferase family protein [Candidatus Gracilibacteria bacterium]